MVTMARQWRDSWNRRFSDTQTLVQHAGRRSGMKANRVWVEIVLLGTAAACALALLLATLGAAAGAATGEVGSAAPGSEQTYQGMVTCSRCEAKHSTSLGTTAGKCILACVRGGATFALVDGDRTYLLDGDLIVLKQVAGRRARIVGAVKGNTIKVSSVAAA
jgi:hypothetical protein